MSEKKKGLENRFTAENGALDLKFTTPSECEILSGGPTDPSARQKRFRVKSRFLSAMESRSSTVFVVPEAFESSVYF